MEQPPYLVEFVLNAAPRPLQLMDPQGGVRQARALSPPRHINQVAIRQQRHNVKPTSLQEGSQGHSKAPGAKVGRGRGSLSVPASER